MKVSLSKSARHSSRTTAYQTHHSNIPSAIAAFAIMHTVPKQTLSPVMTAVDIELKAQTSDIVPSIPVITAVWLSFESANHTGAMSRYVNAKGVMSEQNSRELIEMGAALLQFSFHQLMTMFIRSVVASALYVLTKGSPNADKQRITNAKRH